MSLACELRLGRWQDALHDVTCDAFVSDPPYGARTHAGQQHERHDSKHGAARISQHGLGYGALTEQDVHELVHHWSPRTRGWMCLFTSHDLVSAFEREFAAAGRYVFSPLACVTPGRNVRLAGDGPAQWSVWLLVARPRSMRGWGALPGAYVGGASDAALGSEAGYERVPGGKPLWLMRAVVRDYSAPGDTVCDPYAGGGTTLLAARYEGRRAVGAEMDPERYALAQRNLDRPYTLSLFG